MNDYNGVFAETSLNFIADEAKEWLLNCAAPLWSQVGWHDKGLFAERLSLEGRPDNCPRRLFVQARHIYSFTQIGKLGWDGPWEQLANASIDYLLAHGRRDDGFFMHKFTSDGLIEDPRADLYDQAFIMFCFGHAGHLLNRPELFEAAEILADLLEKKWRRPNGGFYGGELSDQSIRLQNPHMHLFEAFSALSAVTGKLRWKSLAEEMAILCRRHFIDAGSGALLEYFDNSWRPFPGIKGQIVEPGHCSEWAWLFERLCSSGWDAGRDISDRLMEFARLHGVDQIRGVMINEVLLDGTVHNASARLWPQTERLKAAVARLGRTRNAEEQQEVVHAYSGLRRYFEVPIPGTWRDKLNADSTWVAEHAPGSSLYHITCGFVELIEHVQEVA